MGIFGINKELEWHFSICLIEIKKECLKLNGRILQLVSYRYWFSIQIHGVYRQYKLFMVLH
jgi:hypothetical protein